MLSPFWSPECRWLLFCPGRLLPPPCLAKVGKPSRSKHNALPSGSLQFRALSKEDHGEWECVATNVVTSITASTHLTVIGMDWGLGRAWHRCPVSWGSSAVGDIVPRTPAWTLCLPLWDRQPLS